MGGPNAERFTAVPNLIDWNVAVPRMGAVLDLGHGKTLLKATYDRYCLPPGTSLTATVNPNPPDWWTRYAWADLNANGVWEPGEEYREIGRKGGAATEAIDPALKLPRLDEVAGWLEHELPRGLGVRTGIVWRGTRGFFERQNVNQPRDAFTVPVLIQDPGIDGVLGTSDDGPAVQGYDLPAPIASLASSYMVRNVPNASSSNWSWELSASRRSRGRWSFTAAFAHTWDHDHAAAYAGQAVRNNIYPETPNDLINTGPDGRQVFTTWTFKAYGTYAAPWDVRLTPVVRHQSGQPFGRTFVATLNYGNVRILAEPIDTRRMDNMTVVDLRAEKGVRLGGRRRLMAFADVFNLANTNAEQNDVWSSGPSFLRPVTILPPRVLRVGLKADW